MDINGLLGCMDVRNFYQCCEWDVHVRHGDFNRCKLGEYLDRANKVVLWIGSVSKRKIVLVDIDWVIASRANFSL